MVFFVPMGGSVRLITVFYCCIDSRL